jgi:hypothetical protein
MRKENRSPYYFPLGIISLIVLPFILLYYSWNNPLLRQRYIEMFGRGKVLDDHMIAPSISYKYNITKNDFPYSRKIEELISVCAKQDSMQMQHGEITLNISREILYQDFIFLLERIQTTDHYLVRCESWDDSFEYYVLYRYKKWMDIPPPSFNFMRRDYEYEYADNIEKIKLLVERNTPYRYYYLAQIFKDNQILWLIPIVWLLLVLFNIIRLVKFHKMRRLTRRFLIENSGAGPEGVPSP